MLPDHLMMRIPDSMKHADAPGSPTEKVRFLSGCLSVCIPAFAVVDAWLLADAGTLDTPTHTKSVMYPYSIGSCQNGKYLIAPWLRCAVGVLRHRRSVLAVGSRGLISQSLSPSQAVLEAKGQSRSVAIGSPAIRRERRK